MDYGNAGAKNEPQREREVMVQMSDLGRAIANLDAEVKGLSERLAQVQRSEPPATSGNPAPTAVLCPLAEQIRSYTRDIERLGAALHDNRNRLEI